MTRLDPAWVPARDPMIIACGLSAFTGEPGTCRWCATPLPRKKDGGIAANRRWCTEACTLAFLPAHDWQQARLAALRRDQWTCQACGRIGWSMVPRDLLGNTAPMPPVWPYPTGDRNGPLGELFRIEGGMHARQTMRDRRYAGRGLTRHPLEVNHIDPRRGEGYTTGCHNHPANLETLCVPCHGKVTGAQRRARARGHDDRVDAAALIGAQRTLL